MPSLPDGEPAPVAAGEPQPAAPVASDGQAVIDAVAALHVDTRALHERLDELQRSFDVKLKYDETKAKQVETLHAELQLHRADLQLKLMRPLFMDLIQLHDDMASVVRHEQGRGADGGAAANLRSFLATIETILDRYGVTAYTEEADTLAPQRQRPVSFVDTADAALNRTVAQRLRKGFSYGDRVLRPEMVAVYRLARATSIPVPEGASPSCPADP
jgi:molecular chaperone GrpE